MTKTKEMTKKQKKFKPYCVPRYLPGSVPANVLRADLKMYNDHRYQIFAVEPKVDTKPPKMNPYNYIDAKKLAEDAQRLIRIDTENKSLLRKINIINRHGGKVETFNPKAYDRGSSKWAEHELESKKIVKHNKVIYDRLIKAKSSYSTVEANKFWNTMVQKMKFQAKFPLVILEQRNVDIDIRKQYSLLGVDETHPENPDIRSMCFLKFKVDNGTVVGKIIVELYSDFVPVTVQNFISLCSGDIEGLTYKNSIIHNVVRNAYCEMGDITLGNGKGGISSYGKTFAEENYNLKHNGPGVFSMIRVGEKENNSQFSITFDANHKLDGKRVVFGKTVAGYKTLQTIMDLGKKVGKPSPPIRIIECGEVPEKFQKKINKKFYAAIQNDNLAKS